MIQNKPAAIEFVKARKVYDTQGRPFEALKPLSLRIEQGEFFGLLGHNGAGKTTAINMLCGVVRPTEGSASVIGIDVQKDSKKAKRYLGVVPQEIYADSFFPLTTMLNIQSKLSGVKPDQEWIHFLLTKLALTEHTKKTTRELSGGMKRRMMIARALVHKPQIIVLDEPTAGVDVELRHSMWEFIGELHRMGLTIVLTTHYLEEAEQFCSRLAILKQGEMITVKTNRELLDLGGKPRLVIEAEGFSEQVANLLRSEHATEMKELGIRLGSNSQGRWELSGDFDNRSTESFAKASTTLCSFANKHGIKVTRLETQEASLEEVFLKLTKK